METTHGHGPDTAAIEECLRHKDLIEACGMICMIVNNRAPELLVPDRLVVESGDAQGEP